MFLILRNQIFSVLRSLPLSLNFLISFKLVSLAQRMDSVRVERGQYTLWRLQLLA